MVRMTDLLKKAKGAETKKRAPLAEKEKTVIPKKKPPTIERIPIREEAVPRAMKPPVVEEELTTKEEPRAEQTVEFSGLMGKGKGPASKKEDITHKFMRASIPNEEETTKLYFEAIEFVKKIFNIYKNEGDINKEDMTNMCHKIVNNILAGPGAFLKLFHKMDSLEYNRYYNAVNVSVLAAEIGIIYKYNKSILLDLAMIGLLHDMELMKSDNIIKKPKKLSKEELDEIKKHPINLAAFIDSAFNLKDEVVKGILQHHERRDGQGYPHGLTDRDIHDLAAIVSIADTYEAMTHSRPYKDKMPAHDAVIHIINLGKKLFPNETVKALVSCVGLYPAGSWIELNTGEVAKVLAINADNPLRPIVNVLIDSHKNKLKEPRVVDLLKIPSIYVKRSLVKADA